MTGTSRSLAVALAAVVLAATLVASVPAAAASAPESASFTRSDKTYVVTRGEEATITVSHSAPANLTIGSQSAGFEVVVHLGGSGTSTVNLDTYNTTAPTASGFVSGGSATLRTAQLDHAIVPNVYDLRVEIGGTLQDVAELDVRARGNTTGWRGAAPGELDALEGKAGDLYGGVNERDTVAKGDYAAFVVNESGLGRAFDPDRLDGSAGANGVRASVVELDPPPNTQPDGPFVASADRHVYVIPQVEENDRFLVLWDTSDVSLHAESNHTYEFRLSLTPENNLVAERTRLVTKRIRVVEPSLSLSADPGFSLTPWDGSGVRVNGTTNLAAGSTLSLRALEEPHLWKHGVTVSENGTFGATFDFSAASRPSTFPLWVLDHREETEHTVRLTAANASVAFPDQRANGSTVTVSRAVLSQGGFVAVKHNESVRGRSTYLPPGEHEDVAVDLGAGVTGPRNFTAVAVADVNGNETLDEADEAYNVSGSLVTDDATVRPARQSTTTSSGTTKTGSETQQTISVHEEQPLTPVPANQTGGGSSGGFVPLSPLTVLAGLAAGALVAWRR